jgi:hypothetical protein
LLPFLVPALPIIIPVAIAVIAIAIVLIVILPRLQAICNDLSRQLQDRIEQAPGGEAQAPLYNPGVDPAPTAPAFETVPEQQPDTRPVGDLPSAPYPGGTPVGFSPAPDNGSGSNILQAGQRDIVIYTEGPRRFTYRISGLKHEYDGHRSQWGFTQDWNKTMGSAFASRLNDHIQNAPEVIQGTYRGTRPAIHYYDSESRLWVATSPDGELLAAWELDSRQIENMRRNGNVQ